MFTSGVHCSSCRLIAAGTSVIATLMILIGGCTSGPKLPQYVPPDLPKDQAATLKGHGGTTIVSVDMAEVKGSGIQMGNFGGNHVTLAPGHHRVVVTQATSSSTSFSSNTLPFEFDFRAGHVYKVGPRGMFDRNLELINETTGERTAMPR